MSLDAKGSVGKTPYYLLAASGLVAGLLMYFGGPNSSYNSVYSQILGTTVNISFIIIGSGLIALTGYFVTKKPILAILPLIVGFLTAGLLVGVA